MENKLNQSKVIVPSHYSFILSSDEAIKDNEENYNLLIKKQSSGDFEVIGDWNNIQSFVDDICIGDHQSINDILDTETQP